MYIAFRSYYFVNHCRKPLYHHEKFILQRECSGYLKPECSSRDLQKLFIWFSQWDTSQTLSFLIQSLTVKSDCKEAKWTLWHGINSCKRNANFIKTFPSSSLLLMSGVPIWVCSFFTGISIPNQRAVQIVSYRLLMCNA